MFRNKAKLIGLLLFIIGLFMAATYTTKIYKDSGGDRQVVASGGILDIASGGNMVFVGDTMAMAKNALTRIGSDSVINIYVAGLDSGDIAIITVNNLTGTTLGSVYEAFPKDDTLKVKFNMAVSSADSAEITYQVWKD